MLKVSSHNDRLLYDVRADITADPQTIFAELESLDWQYTSGFPKRAFFRPQSKDADPLPENLKFICDSIRNQQKELLTYMYENVMFAEIPWMGVSLEQLLNNTSVYCDLIRDDPGWMTGIHIDHRSAVTVGMIFFEPTDDVKKSTYFYTNESRDKEKRMSCKFGEGWYAANTHRSWHTGGNMGTDVRYSITFSSFLSLPAN